MSFDYQKMVERRRNFGYDEGEKYSSMEDEETRAVFVDTNLDTHIAVPISPLSTVYSLKEQIAYEHRTCFPDYGNITVNLILVKLNKGYYHLPDSMLLKTAFHGLPKTWSVSADVFTPVGHLESQNHYKFKHIESSAKNHYDCYHVQLSDKHYHDFNHVQPSCQHHHEFEHVEPSTQQHNELNHVQPSSQDHYEFKHVLPSSQPRATLDLSCNVKQKKKKKKKKKKQRTQMGKIGTDKNIPLKDPSEFEKTREQGQLHVPRTVNVCATKHLNGPREGHHDTSAVQPSAVHPEVGGENIVKELGKVAELVHQMEDTGTNLVTLNKEGETDNFGASPGPRAKSSRKRKKSDIHGVNQSDAATSVQGPGILEKGAAPSDNKNTIHKSKKKCNETAEELSPSQLNNVRELLPQHELLSVGKENGEDIASLKLDITGDKSAAYKHEQEKGTAEELSLFQLNNVPELLVSQHESSNIVERQKEIKGDVDPLKLEKTAKRRKRHKSNQNLSSKRPNDDEIADDSRHIDDFSRPEESVDTTSENLKMSKNSNAVPKKGSPGSLEAEKLDEETKEKPASTAVIQSGKPKKRSHKKHSVPAPDPSSLPVNQHIDETTMELDASRKVERMDDRLTNRNTDDDPLKLGNTDKETKTNEDELDCRTGENVSLSLLNNVPKHLSQHESLNLVERKSETEEDTAPLKSENTGKKKKNKKAKSSDSVNKNISSKRQNADQNADDSVNKDFSNNKQIDDQIADDLVKKGFPDKRQNDDPVADEATHISAELLLQDNIGRPEESVEVMIGKLEKRSRKWKDVLGKDHPGSTVKEQPDEETKEMVSPISVIQNDKPKKKSKKKQPVPVQVDVLLANSDINAAQSQNKVIRSEGYQDQLSEIPCLEVPSGSVSLRLAIEQKENKLDQPSLDNVSGHNLVDSMKNGSARRSGLQNLITEKVGDSCASVDDGSKASGANYITEMVTFKRADDHLTDCHNDDAQKQKEVRQGEEHHDEFSQAPRLEASAVLAEVGQLENLQAIKQKTQKLDQLSSIDMSSNGSLVSKKSRGNAKCSEVQKSISDQKHEKSIPLLSEKDPTISKEVNGLVPLSDPTSTLRKAGVSCASAHDVNRYSEESSMTGSTVRKIRQGQKAKESPNKLGNNDVSLRRPTHLSVREPVSASAQKKGLLASGGAIFEDGSSSDDEDRTDASCSSATVLPGNLSSSDYSEGESEDSSKGDGRGKANSSGRKLESILRSSSRYKKAKLMASQLQGESEPVEFVPDSQADM